MRLSSSICFIGSSELSGVTKSETSGAGQECPAYRLLDIYPKSCTLVYCVERRLDSPREMDVIMTQGR